jgi:hypothetical protein
VRNVGRGTVDVVGLQATGLNAGLDLEGAPFVGPLDAGGSAPLDLLLTPTRGGTVQLNVHVAYRDDLNRVQTWSQALTFEVEANVPLEGQPEAQELSAPSSSPAAWHALLLGLKGFLGLGS